MSPDLTTRLNVRRDYFGTVDAMEAMQLAYTRQNATLGTETTLALPYTTSNPLPAPLPTLAQIEKAKKEAEGHTEGDDPVQVGPYLVKAGTRVAILQETENLTYLARNSSVRVPKVYAVFAAAEAQDAIIGTLQEQTLYLITELIPGTLLSSLFPSLKLAPPLIQKVGRLLGAQLCALRSVQPGNIEHFGRVNGLPYNPSVHLAISQPPRPKGSTLDHFTYDTVVRTIIHTGIVFDALMHDCAYTDFDRAIFAQAYTALLDDARAEDRMPVLTHGNVEPSSILVDFERDVQGNIVDVMNVVLTDWSALAWMPAWYEVAAVMMWDTGKVAEGLKGVGRGALEGMGRVNIAMGAFNCVTTPLKGGCWVAGIHN